MKILSCLAALLLACNVAAQSYPDKPVRLIVPFPPGGSNDVVGRVIGAQLGERLGQTVIIDNRGGAGGTIGITAAAKAAPDGYTLLMVSVGLSAQHGARLDAGPSRPSGLLPSRRSGLGPSVLVVPASLPVNSLQELIALAKRKPGSLNAGSAGAGSFQHLATELFRLRTGIDIVIIQYKGGGPALTDTIAGQVHLNVGSVIQNLPHVRSGKLKALGVGSAKRIAPLPEVPTFAEQGVTGAEANNWWGIVVPVGTPAAVIARLEREARRGPRFPRDPQAFRPGRRGGAAHEPAQFSEFMARETARWIRVVKEAGIKAE
jgi:tripartite-type tricarboxylate transporter receptor subunit TctC